MLLAASCQSPPVPALAIVRPQAEQAALAGLPGGMITRGELLQRDERWVWVFQAVTPGQDSYQELVVNARTGRLEPQPTAAQHETGRSL